MIKKFIGIAIIFCALVAAWIWTENRNAELLYPPSGATNILTFLEVRTNYVHLGRFTNGGDAYFEVVGEMSRSLLASGPPIYIFDGSGALVDWSGNSGDDTSFVFKWASSSNAASISSEEVKQLLKTNMNGVVRQ
jgi:hypothetical protein